MCVRLPPFVFGIERDHTHGDEEEPHRPTVFIFDYSCKLHLEHISLFIHVYAHDKAASSSREQ